jgi:hypothetical protein
MWLSVLPCEIHFCLMIRETLSISWQPVSFNLSEVYFYRCTVFRSSRWTGEVLGHWKAPRSDKHDIGEKIKWIPDRWPRTLRIDGVSKLTRIHVRGPVLKNQSGVIGVLKKAIKNSREIWISWSKFDRTVEHDTQIIEWHYAKLKYRRIHAFSFIFQGISILISLSNSLKIEGIRKTSNEKRDSPQKLDFSNRLQHALIQCLHPFRIQIPIV